MKLTPVSGLGAKGPACFLVETGDARHLPMWQAAFAPARVVLDGRVAL
jgi:hypothetical protein